MKRPLQIETVEQYNDLVEKYDRKGRLSNDYIQFEAADLIAHNCLYSICGQDNAVLLVQKSGFFRLYYYLNNVEERLSIPDEELVSEILFRGDRAPEAEVQWLEGLGFRKNLVRDLYFAKYSSFTEPTFFSNFTVKLAQTLQEVQWAVMLFNDSFDKWSGDYISHDKCEYLFRERQILLARDGEGDLIGALQFENRQGVCWLNHVAVLFEARGKKVGRGLLEAYIEQGHINGDNSRYMLWVQRQNKNAVGMYRNKGFIPLNKSTLSMIKV